MPTPKIFDVVDNGNTLVITPLQNTGAVPAEEINLALESLAARFAHHEAKHVVFDFRKVAYFGSSMLGVMHAIWKHVAAGSGKMVVCNVSDVGREILRVSRFDTLWPVCETQEEALAVVNGVPETEP